ncbi:MAG: hypothetical protein A2176_12510 [Spirochaetes bacterium RBG_13_51_14]|nr:MAG: hypothetical protein A2176_12510 [Spirochaetes bacterium RBG_13_51_14]
MDCHDLIQNRLNDLIHSRDGETRDTDFAGQKKSGEAAPPALREKTVDPASNIMLPRINFDQVIQYHIDSNKNLAILVSEDDLINQKFLEVAILKIGFTCDLAGDGRETLDMMRRKRYDILFLDMQMPVMNGEEVLASLRRENLIGSTYIIAQTAYSMKGDREKYLSLGCRSYISKPVHGNMLKLKIAEAILALS